MSRRYTHLASTSRRFHRLHITPPRRRVMLDASLGRNSPMMSSGTSSCRTHRGGTMRRPGCCCSLGSRAAQVYWLAKCHTPLASAIGPKRPSTQPQTTATYKTPYAHPNIQTHCHLEHRQSSHWWICDNPTSLLHPTTSSTSNFKLHRHALPPHACGEGPVVRQSGSGGRQRSEGASGDGRVDGR